MKFAILSTSVVLLFNSFGYAQTTTTISGTVSDQVNSPVEAATVTLFRKADTVLAKIAVTDKVGSFIFEGIKPDTYFVKVTAVGFAPIRSEDISTSDKVIIRLMPAQASLSSVTVTATKPMVENKIDKTVVNVDAFITNAGGTALDVLERSPGISVDRDGNISLRGKQGVIVLIDGKQTFLGGQDLANFLRNLPSNQLDQVEIMSQPSARFDASGNSGIINIKTKKNKQSGLTGSINLSYVQGVYPKSPNSFNINYRRNRVNLFATYGYSYWQGFSNLEIQRKFRTKEDLTELFDQRAFQRFSGTNQSLRTGMDYTIDKKTTIGFGVNGMFNPRRFSADNSTRIFDGFGQHQTSNTALSSSRDPWKNFGANANFRRIIDTSGAELTADLDYLWYSSKMRQISDNYTFAMPSGNLLDSFLLRGFLPSTIRIYSGKVDYSKPLKKGARFEAGLKSSYVETDNDAQYTMFDNFGEKWIKDTMRSNHFLYNENINAAYVNYSRQYKKLGVQAGLRLEHTAATGTQLANAESFKRNYAQLFPTLYISYAASKANNFGVSYGRRIERPNYQDMNPFQYFLDQFTYRQGNPYLTPQFSHNIELSHNFKGRLNTALNYTATTDIINDILKQNDSTKVTFQTRENIAKRRNIGLAVSLNTPVTKWWTVSLFTNVFNNHFEGFVNNNPLNANITSAMMNVNNQLKFPKGWGGEVSGFYRTRMQDGGIIVAEPMGVISFGASKQILKNKGTLRLNVVDPFWIQRFRGFTKFGSIDAVIKSEWDNRRVGLAFTYRFGKQQNGGPAPRRKTGSAQEEQNRVGGGQQQ